MGVHSSAIEEAVDIIRAFYTSDVSEPIVIRLTDDLYADFLCGFPECLRASVSW